MKAVFILGTVSRNAMDGGEAISGADIEAMQHISEKAGVEADIVLACEAKETWGKGRQATMRQINAEKPRLREEVASLKPELIVAFGPTAASAVLGRRVKMADVIHKQVALDEWCAPVWITHSLEEASVKPGLVKFIGSMLLHAAKGETDVRWRDHTVTDWRAGPDPRLNLDAGLGSLDLETYPGTDPRHPNARIRMAVVSTSPGFAQVVQAGPNSELPSWLREWCESGRTLWGGSNIQFDAYWLRVVLGWRWTGFVDTSQLQHILDENMMQKDLKSLVLLYTNIGDYSREQRELVKKRGGWEYIKDEEMYQYAGADGYGGYEVFAKQMAEIEKRGLGKALRVHIDTYDELSRLMNNGARLDMEENAALEERYVARLSALAQEIRAEIGPININSPKQLVPALMQAVPGIKLTEWLWKHWDDDDEKFSTKKAVLQRESHKHPIIAKVLEWRRRETLRRFVTGIRKHTLKRGVDTYVESNIRGDVTVTHRMSSSKPNLQNLPRDTEEEAALQLNVKRQYVSRWINGSLSEADQSQLELRVAAVIAQDRAMMDAFLRGTDVHTELAAMMRRITPDQVTKEIRQAGKTTNFHVLYGGKAFGLSLRLGCGKAEADELIAQFYATFKDFADWQHEQEAFAKKHLYVEGMLGQRRHFVRPEGWNTPAGKRILRQAVNAPIQGDASKITNLGIAAAMRRMREEKLRSVMFLTVHDSGLTDNYPGEEERVHQILREEMEHPDLAKYGVQFNLPLVVDIKTGSTWGSMRELAVTP